MSLPSDPPAQPPLPSSSPAGDDNRTRLSSNEPAAPINNLQHKSAAVGGQDESPEQHIPNDDAHVDQRDNDEDETQQEKAEPPPPPLDFAPFYTLLIDPTTGSHAHPTVHYIFADDDPDILTSALLASANGDRPSTDADATSHSASDAPEERVVIVDLSNDGKQVVATTSLAPDWQALTTSVTPAPSWGAADEDDEGGADKGLMLKISGLEFVNKEREKNKSHGDLDTLMQVFDQGLSDLAGVLDD